MYCIVSFQVYLRLRKRAMFLPGIQSHVPFGHWMGLRDKSKHMLWSVPSDVISHRPLKTVGANATLGFHTAPLSAWVSCTMPGYSTTHHFPINTSLRSSMDWKALCDVLDFLSWSACFFPTRFTVCGLKQLQGCEEEDRQLRILQVLSAGLPVV